MHKVLWRKFVWNRSWNLKDVKIVTWGLILGPMMSCVPATIAAIPRTEIRYSTFVNWEFWWPHFPVLVYFKEIQTKPDGQIHFFRVLFNGKQLYEAMVERLGPSETSGPKNLPRHQFGNLQSKIFPAYFTLVGVCCAISVAAFAYLHPYKTASIVEKYQLGFLLSAFAFNLGNLVVFTPMTIELYVG